MNKHEIIFLAMERLGWTEAKVRSWYKEENRWLNGLSPKELVDRGEAQEVVDFLMSRQKDYDDTEKEKKPKVKPQKEKKKLWFKP